MIFLGEHLHIASRILNNKTRRRHRHSDWEVLLRVTLCANRLRIWVQVRDLPNRITSIRYHHGIRASRAYPTLRGLVKPIPGSSLKQMCLVEQCHISSAPNARWTLMVIPGMMILRLVANVAGERRGSLLPI